APQDAPQTRSKKKTGAPSARFPNPPLPSKHLPSFRARVFSGGKPASTFPENALGSLRCLLLRRIAQHVAAAPDRLDVMLTVRCSSELLAQLADEDVDDLELRLVHAAIEMVQEHLLGERRAFAQAQQLEHLVLLAGEMHSLPVDLDRLG